MYVHSKSNINIYRESICNIIVYIVHIKASLCGKQNYLLNDIIFKKLGTIQSSPIVIQNESIYCSIVTSQIQKAEYSLRL